jgi:hypothetical protein
MSAPDPTTELGDGLKRAADATTPRPVDVDAVLAASRSRRRTRRTAIVSGAAAAAGVLVVGGLVFGLQGGGGGGSTTADVPISSESAGSAEVAPEAAQGDDAASGLRLAAPESVYRCGAAVVPAAAAASAPLVVSVVPPVAPVAPGSAESVTVTVTNAGTEVVTGDLSRVPSITVADDGVVAWHSSRTSESGATHVSLEPGESVTLTGTVSALRCTAADDDGTGLPADLPPLPPGAYTMGAAVAFSTPAEGMVLLLPSPFVPFSVG